MMRGDKGTGPGGRTWVDGVGFTHNPEKFSWVAEGRARDRAKEEERREEGRMSEYDRADKADSAPGATKKDRVNYIIASIRKSLLGG